MPLKAVISPCANACEKSVTEAARFISVRGIIKEGGPVLARFVAQTASRLGVV
jgi:hypothetical protein